MTSGPSDLDPAGRLRRRWLWYADHEFTGYSPLYERISRAVADDRTLVDLLVSTLSREEQQPLLLLAAVHYLVLGGLDHPVAAAFRGEPGAGDPAAAFLDLVRVEQERVLSVVRSHRTQTNEVGRSAVLAPALRHVAARFGEPLALVEAGASAGLNLRLPHYRLDYGSAGATGPADAAVVVRCEVRCGHPPITARAPALDPVVGIDLRPADVRDPDTARWLCACIWPDTGRLPRIRAAIEVARAHPVPIRRGDATEELPAVLAGLPPGRPAVVVTTWVLAYLKPDDRDRFAAAVAAAARDRPVAWISAEGPGVVRALEGGADVPRGGTSVLGVVSHHADRTESTLLAVVHPHGNWLEWRA